MKCVKWIVVVLKELEYIVRNKKMMVNSEQIRFQKRTEEEGPLSQTCVLICPEKNLRVEILFGVGLIHASDFGGDATNCQILQGNGSKR